MLRHPTARPLRHSCAIRSADSLLTRGNDSYPQITQIYEGTNQVQRVVMARQLLRR